MSHLQTIPTGRGRIGQELRGLTQGGQTRVLAIVAPGPAQETVARHGLQDGAAVLAAESLVATALLASQIKGDERLTVQLQAEQPPFSMMAEVREGGLVRARFRPQELPLTREFTGMLLAIKAVSTREVYRGVTPIEDESVASALERSLRQSGQVRARVRIEASLDASGSVAAATGLLLEAMPGNDDFASWVDELLTRPLVDLVTELAFGSLGGEKLELLEVQDVEYSCTCSKERIERTLRALGAEDLEELLAEQGQAEACCQFCNEVYVVDAVGLEAIITELRQQPRA